MSCPFENATSDGFAGADCLPMTHRRDWPPVHHTVKLQAFRLCEGADVLHFDHLQSAFAAQMPPALCAEGVALSFSAFRFLPARQWG